MDNIETPYDEDAEFIQCTVCDKSIRGETLYKIHLTTPGHLKKEDVLVAAGLAVRQHTIPVFEDIVHYLDYVKLNEPIIGLSYLDEIPCHEQQTSPRYTCRLCHQTANIQEMVHHVIGRKHRQKYVEMKRPDLVTWDTQSIVTQGGKIIRAKAEIIERQDGRGSPSTMTKKRTEDKFNMSRVPQRQRQSRDRNFPQSSAQPSHLPRLMDYQNDSPRGRYSQGYPNKSPIHPEDSYRDRGAYEPEDTVSHDCMKEEQRRTDYRENNTHRPEYMDPDYRRQYDKGYMENPQQRAAPGPRSGSRYDSREEMSLGQPWPVEAYPVEAPPDRRSYSERDPLKEFYSEEVRRGRVCSAEYQPSQPGYPEGDDQGWSLDSKPGRHDSMYRDSRQELIEPEAKWRSSPENDQSRDLLFDIIRDYCHENRGPYQEDAIAEPGPSRTGPPASQRRVEGNRTMSNIPEPFRRFLKGASNDEGHVKRKRKSRFSDATAEEVATTKEMFSDEFGPPNPKFGGRLRPAGAPVRPEVHELQHPDLYGESQSPRHAESYQKGGSESGSVFDMLKNIEIENEEEAEYLKSKICSLLKEFKSKKSEKAVQNSQGRAVVSNDYNSLQPDSEPSLRHQYDMSVRKDSDHRRTEGRYFKEDHRGRGWNQHEHVPDEQLQEHHRLVHREPMHSNRGCYEDAFGWPKSQTPHASHPDDPADYPERFQEPMHPRDYRPAAEELLDSHSSAPPLHMQRGPRMDRGRRYPSNLDKITSTLLELVARK